MDNNHIPIDAVIPWVDVGDAKHLEKVLKYIPKTEVERRKKLKKQLIEVEELKYVVHSILKYAQFIRHIYIVTDNQRPKFLNTSNADVYAKVKIIDHKEIFKEDVPYLPVFNPLSIETKFYEIPNLSEHFIYFNDDFFLLKPVTQSHFFQKGNPVIRGKWRKFREDIFYKKIIQKKKHKKYSYRTSQDSSAKTIGFNKVFRGQHTPRPLRQSTLKTFFNQNREIEITNINTKFRNVEQLNVQAVANHIEIKNKTCLKVYNYQLVKITSHKRSIAWLYFFLNVLTKKRNAFFLNIQQLNLYSENNRRFVLNWLENKFKI